MQTLATALGTLNNSTGILIAGPALTRGGRALSVVGSQSISILTPGDGPFEFGIMAGDLTLTELEAYLELGGPLTPSDRAAVEVASRGRYLRRLGILVPQGNGTVACTWMPNTSLSGLRFSEAGEAQGGWDWWLYNQGRDLTTGSSWQVSAGVFCEFNPSG